MQFQEIKARIFLKNFMFFYLFYKEGTCNENWNKKFFYSYMDMVK